MSFETEDKTVVARVRKQLRSWMFIYIGLVAAIILSGQPAKVEAGTSLGGSDLPLILNAPLQRGDI